MKRKFQQLSIFAVLVVFWATFMTDGFNGLFGGVFFGAVDLFTPNVSGR